VLPASFTRQRPAISSICSGAAVSNVSFAGRITPTLFRDPSASRIVWLMQRPSK
jgi:hypothetical protein